MGFPIDISGYEPVKLNASDEKLTQEQKAQLEKNIKIARDAIVFYTAYAGAKGLSGHTGGAYDVVPEVLIIDGFIKGGEAIYPAFFDEAGHRVAIQYLMAVLDGDLPLEKLLHYREFSEKDPLPGHPERALTSGIKFSSGRLGHMWSTVNGIAKANPDKSVFILGSDGSQQEGCDAEAARFSVAQNLNVKMLVDDNNVTIAGHPTEYMKGYDIEKTLAGHGMKTDVGDPEDLDSLYSRIRNSLTTKGPVALINRRPMAVGIKGAENQCNAHEVLKVDVAVGYLEERGYSVAVEMLKNVEKTSHSYDYLGSNDDMKKNRGEFGKIVVDILGKMSPEEREEKIYVIDSDLEGSTGLKSIREAYPEITINGGIMERNNYAAAAGFGFDKGKQGIFATFSAFAEMCCSEITMARLNKANAIAHFSHAGVDQISDNTCHFGMNIFFTDNGLLEEKNTKLYFAADAGQLKVVLEKVFWDEGLRFIFSTRSVCPQILKEDGSLYYENYKFTPGKDEVIREGKDGYIVSYGALLYRALDAVERLKKEGIDIGLINKPTLNVVDDEMMKKLSGSPMVLVVEDQNIKTGLGVRFGTWLLKKGFKGTYDHLGTHREGMGGIHEQIPHQGLDSPSIQKKVKSMK